MFFYSFQLSLKMNFMFFHSLQLSLKMNFTCNDNQKFVDSNNFKLSISKKSLIVTLIQKQNRRIDEKQKTSIIISKQHKNKARFLFYEI